MIVCSSVCIDDSKRDPLEILGSWDNRTQYHCVREKYSETTFFPRAFRKEGASTRQASRNHRPSIDRCMSSRRGLNLFHNTLATLFHLAEYYSCCGHSSLLKCTLANLFHLAEYYSCCGHSSLLKCTLANLFHLAEYYSCYGHSSLLKCRRAALAGAIICCSYSM